MWVSGDELYALLTCKMTIAIVLVYKTKSLKATLFVYQALIQNTIKPDITEKGKVLLNHVTKPDRGNRWRNRRRFLQSVPGLRS